MVRTIEPITASWAKRRRKCTCGGIVTHIGVEEKAGRSALIAGCELCVRRWIRHISRPGAIPINGFKGDE